MSTREINLEGTPPWGFRMNGGADAGHPLRISRVNPGSKAEAKGIREGDLISSINGQSTKCLTNSESHALLRTVKENLRLGLNEDKNSSPRRRSKEIKSTSSTLERESIQSCQQFDSKGNTIESGKPSSSKCRRQRRSKLKMKLKEVLGYRENKGSIINLHPDLGGISNNNNNNNLQNNKLSSHPDGISLRQSDTNSDNSSAILYDNYQEIMYSSNNGGKHDSLDGKDLPNNNEQMKNLYFKRSITPPDRILVTQQQNYSVSNTECCSSGSRPGSPLPILIPIDEPKAATITMLKHNIQHGTLDEFKQEEVDLVKIKNDKTVNIVEKTICNLDEIKPDIITSTNEERFVKMIDQIKKEEKPHEPVEVIITPAETEVVNKHKKCIKTNVIVHHPDDICEENIKFLPPNVISDLSVVKIQPVEPIEEETYELSVKDLYTPLISCAEEKELRSFLETLNLNSPEELQTEEVKVMYSNHPPDSNNMYYYMPKRQLDVITEETSDLSDADKPGNNKESHLEKQEETGGIDTSWSNCQSIEEVSDVLIVSDSLSDTDLIMDGGKLRKTKDKKEKHVKYLDNVIEKPLNSPKNIGLTSNTSKSLPINYRTAFNSISLSAKPPKIPPNEKPIPSMAIVKNVISSYCNSKYTIEPVNIKTNTVETKEIKPLPENKPMKIDDVVEIVYIDSSDSDVLSTKSANSSFSSIKSQTFDDDEIIVNNNCKEISNNLSINNIIYDINQTVKHMTSDEDDNDDDAVTIDKTINDKKLNNKNNVKEKKSLVVIKQEEAVLSNNQLPDRRFSYPFSKTDCVYSDVEDCENVRSLSSKSTETISSQSTTRHYFLTQVLTLKEICTNIVLNLPNGLEILKQLGIDYVDFDDFSGYIPEGSECSTSSRQLSEKELIKSLNEDTENELNISQDFPTVLDPVEELLKQDKNLIDDSWVGVQITTNPRLLVCFSPSQLKQMPTDSKKVTELLDLHHKFIERRGYHENISSPPPPPALPNKNLETITNEELEQFNALKMYHESRQEKMRMQRKSEIESTNIIKSADQRKLKSTNEYDEDDEPIFVYNVTPKKETENKGINDKDKIKEEKVNEVVGTSRLLELIQNLDPKSSISKSNPDIIYPQWILLPKETAIDDKFSEKLIVSTVEPEKNKSTENFNKKSEEKKNVEIIKSEVKLIENKKSKNVNENLEKFKKISTPSTCDVFRQTMYEEYMSKLAALAERRQMKIIKISTTDTTIGKTNNCYTNTNSMAEIGQLESEFMEKVKQRMHKLGLSFDDDDADADDDTGQKNDTKQQQQSVEINQNEILPKHLKELMEITQECGDDKIIDSDGLLIEIDQALSPERKGFLTKQGVWSPVQTPETERKKYDFTGETKKEKVVDVKDTEPQPVVWTPKSAGASPTFERKYRTVNFQSPPQQRKEYITSVDDPELLKEFPQLPVDNQSSSRLVTSASENSTLSTQLRLPSAQNPTITLLQKAREGQIPKGAQYLDESEVIYLADSSLRQDEILYDIKNEYTSNEEDRTKKIIELSPRRFEGIGPTTKEGIPIVLRSEIKEDNKQKWYKRMYDSLHKADHDKDFVTVRYKTKRRGQYPFSYSGGGYASEPDRLGYDSDISISKYATLDRRKIRNKENDFTTSTMPRNKYSPAVKYAVDIYKNQPGRIEDYEPGHSSIADKETKQWWDEVLDIFDGELNQQSKSQYSAPRSARSFTYALKDAGYDSDSTLVFKRKENMNQLSPSEQKMAYKVIQRGGDVPLHGLRKPAPERPKESPHRYVESEVNIHYRSPIRSEAKAVWPEEELAERQAEIMRRIYQEQRRTKYLNELHDMYSRRHTDNFIPSQKSPIPLNRYDDFPLEPQPPRPRDRTPEPKLVARALYNFVGQTSRELSFRRGDIIYVRRQIDKNWYEGEHNAMVGLFPFNYVEIIPYDGIRTLPKKANEGQARAKFNFQAQTHLELSLVKGELILLTRRVDENWFEGRIGNRKGIFPVSYVEVLVEPGERAMSPSGPVSTKPIVAPASHSVMLNGAKDLGQQHYQPPRPALYSSSSLPAQNKINDISLVGQTLHIDTQSDPVPYRVLYNYKPQNDDELELKEGDVVYVMEKCDDGWYVGSLHRNGQFGTFPGNYVERIQ